MRLFLALWIGLFGVEDVRQSGICERCLSSQSAWPFFSDFLFRFLIYVSSPGRLSFFVCLHTVKWASVLVWFIFVKKTTTKKNIKKKKPYMPETAYLISYNVNKKKNMTVYYITDWNGVVVIHPLFKCFRVHLLIFQRSVLL